MGGPASALIRVDSSEPKDLQLTSDPGGQADLSFALNSTHALVREAVTALLRPEAFNTGDYKLGVHAGQSGSAVRQGLIKPAEVADIVRKDFCNK
jgi:hypothetical protein